MINLNHAVRQHHVAAAAAAARCSLRRTPPGEQKRNARFRVQQLRVAVTTLSERWWMLCGSEGNHRAPCIVGWPPSTWLPLPRDCDYLRLLHASVFSNNTPSRCLHCHSFAVERFRRINTLEFLYMYILIHLFITSVSQELMRSVVFVR